MFYWNSRRWVRNFFLKPVKREAHRFSSSVETLLCLVAYYWYGCWSNSLLSLARLAQFPSLSHKQVLHNPCMHQDILWGRSAHSHPTVHILYYLSFWLAFISLLREKKAARLTAGTIKAFPLQFSFPGKAVFARAWKRNSPVVNGVSATVKAIALSWLCAPLGLDQTSQRFHSLRPYGDVECECITVKTHPLQLWGLFTWQNFNVDNSWSIR